MPRHAVHRVYAEDEQAAVPYGEHAAVPPDEPAVSYDAQPTESYERPMESCERPTKSHKHMYAQPPWRVRARSRVLATALLCAVVAFLVAFSVHALTTPAHVVGAAAGGHVEPPLPPAPLPRRMVVTHRRRRSHRAPHKSTATHATPAAAHITPPVVLRDEEHVAVHVSTGSAPPAPPERGAIYEFTFER